MPSSNKRTLLVINAGSSSVKFALFRMTDEHVLAKGMVERIGLSGTQIVCDDGTEEKTTRVLDVKNARDAVVTIVEHLVEAQKSRIKRKNGLAAICHRVVHGGEALHAPVIIDTNVKKIIHENAFLAPLHNPPNLMGIEACEALFPTIPQVAVFDTAFHATLPEQSYLYGLPYDLYRDHGIRRYGFHGTSHHYVAKKAATHLQQPLSELKLITCHLGNGSSITAIQNGQSVDTSMGFTPLEGTIMGTRCGSIDPAIVLHLMNHHQLKSHQIDHLLNQESGIKGLSGNPSGDMRDALSAMSAGSARAAAAIQVYAYQIRKFIGAYVAVMNGIDAIVFTAGIGENAPEIREMVCNQGNGLTHLGIVLDAQKNTQACDVPLEIQSRKSRVKLLVIPTDEALEIARQTQALLWPAMP